MKHERWAVIKQEGVWLGMGEVVWEEFIGEGILKIGLTNLLPPENPLYTWIVGAANCMTSGIEIY